MTGLIDFSSFTCYLKALSNYYVRNVNLPSSKPEEGQYTLIKKKFSYSRVITRPSRLQSGLLGKSSIILIGLYLAKIATPEYPSFTLQKFQ